MNKKITQFLVMCSVLVAVSACKGPEPPARGPAVPPEPQIGLKASYVNVPVSADIGRLTELALREVENPISSRTDEVDANLKLQLLKTVEKQVEKKERKIRNEVRHVRKKVGDKCSKILGKLFSKVVCEPVFSLVEVTVQVPHEVTKVVTVVEDIFVSEIRNTKVRVKHEASLASLAINLEGQKLQVVADIDYWLELGAKEEYLSSIRATIDGIATCGVDEGLRRVRVEIMGTIAADDTGNLKFTREGENIVWIRECRLTAADIEVSDILNLPGIKNAFEKAVTRGLDKLPNEYKLRPAIEQAWKQMQSPLQLAEGLSLQINPSNVGLLPIQGRDGVLNTGAGIEFKPVVSYGDDQGPTNIPLPDKLIPVEPAGEFNLLLKGRIVLTALEQKLLAFIKAEGIQIAGRRVEVSEIDLYGGLDNEIVIGVELEKPIGVEIYLIGTPKIDPDAHTIKFTDIDYSIETRNWLAKSADFFLHSAFVKEIERKAEFSFDKVTQQALERIGTFNKEIGPGILTGATKTLRAEDVRIGSEYLHMYISATGNASYRLQM